MKFNFKQIKNTADCCIFETDAESFSFLSWKTKVLFVKKNLSRTAVLSFSEGFGRMLYKHTITQYICTHYSSLSVRSAIFQGLELFFKKVQNMGCKKQGAKNQGQCYSNEKKQPGLFSFWITIILFFAPCFLQPIVWTWFFSWSQTDQWFQNNNSGCKLTGRVRLKFFRNFISSCQEILQFAFHVLFPFPFVS